MGRAMVRAPKVFLFDEPLSNLDAKLRVQMRSEIKQNHQRLKTTTVYVTHDQIEAMTMADRIVVMNDGVIEQVGTPLELYDFPANLFVAGFIGSPAMNMLVGTASGGEFIGRRRNAHRACRQPRQRPSLGSPCSVSGRSISASTRTGMRGAHRHRRADRIRDPGDDAARRTGRGRRIPRAHQREARRDVARQPGARARASVRFEKRATHRRLTGKAARDNGGSELQSITDIKDIVRPPRELSDALAKIGTATASSELSLLGIRDPHIRGPASAEDRANRSPVRR